MSDVYSDSELLSLQDVVNYNSMNSQGRGGSFHLSAVLPALSASLGTPISTAVHSDAERLRTDLGLPMASSVIVVLIDGLGFWNLMERKGHAPYLRSLVNQSHNQRPISSSFPTTTVAALSVFGTGTCPGLTGMTGYSQINPENGQLSQMIQFTNGAAPEVIQHEPTIFEQLSAQNVRVTTSGFPKFADSALTRAALRGSHYISGTTPAQRISAAARASYEPGLTYVYIRDADKMGHQYGWDNERWIGTFERVDAQLKNLARRAAPGTLIAITADHGMITSDSSTRIDIAERPELQQGVALVGGEPRAVSLYVQEGHDPQEVANRWRNALEDKARIYTKEEAIAAGLYGPVHDRVRPYIGDVIAMAASNVTLVDSRTQSEVATRLPAVHGSLTRAELDIPFLIDVL
ncbi:alkaline phosphatase family protein [Alloscardovia omnicolens]|uniref:alkaline phosphatase family protein n=1 Tax=Alloscardovia omnicolens TaxID=419015 RepID=UPI003A6CD15A